jgi:hypothetical protein
MIATYKAVTLDGQEHSDLDLFTLKQWYFARRLNPDSLVLSSETGEWKLLKKLFDQAQWEAEERKTRGLGPTDSVFKALISSQPVRHLPEPMSQTPYQHNRPNELGLRAAGIVLFINATCTLASLAILALQSGNSSKSSRAWGFSILLDVVVGAKLLTSENASRWQKVALVRISLGALLFGLAWMVIGPNDTMRMLGLLEVVFASSFYILLIGQASRTRVTVGVLTFVISICGLVGVLALYGQSGDASAKREILKYKLPTRSFRDVPSGSELTLPDGWVMLPIDNPIIPIPDANMIAVHADTLSYASLRVVRVTDWLSLDLVLSDLVAEQQKDNLSIVELERVNSLFGKLEGRKASLTWQYQGKTLKGEVTVARNGAYNIFLTEWCAAATYSKSRPQFAAFEKAAFAGAPEPVPWPGPNQTH